MRIGRQLKLGLYKGDDKKTTLSGGQEEVVPDDETKPNNTTTSEAGKIYEDEDHYDPDEDTDQIYPNGKDEEGEDSEYERREGPEHEKGVEMENDWGWLEDEYKEEEKEPSVSELSSSDSESKKSDTFSFNAMGGAEDEVPPVEEFEEENVDLSREYLLSDPLFFALSRFFIKPRLPSSTDNALPEVADYVNGVSLVSIMSDISTSLSKLVDIIASNNKPVVVMAQRDGNIQKQPTNEASPQTSIAKPLRETML